MNAFCAILAGGVGKRMGADVPKQFLPIKGVPIVIRTIRQVLAVEGFAAVVVAVHSEWKSKLAAMIAEYGVDTSRVILTHGGSERYDSILNAITAIKRSSTIDELDVVVVHDAVRPFVSCKILRDSIAAASHYGACVATLPAVDTMLVVRDGRVVAVPSRKELFNGQAPDSARVLALERAIKSLSADERKTITGTAQICVLKGIPVVPIEGEPDNIKITTPHDLEVAERILAERGEM